MSFWPLGCCSWYSFVVVSFFSYSFDVVLIWFVLFLVCLFTFRKGSEQSAAALPGWYLTLTSVDQSRLHICQLGVSCRPIGSSKPTLQTPKTSSCLKSLRTSWR